MKKIAALLYAVVLGVSLSAYAAEEVNPKLEQAQELRVKAAKASMEAQKLIKQANDLELEAMQPKAGEKMRGANHSCWRDCWDGGSGRNGNNYTCSRACGYYN